MHIFIIAVNILNCFFNFSPERIQNQSVLRAGTETRPYNFLL